MFLVNELVKRRNGDTMSGNMDNLTIIVAAAVLYFILVEGRRTATHEEPRAEQERSGGGIHILEKRQKDKPEAAEVIERIQKENP